LGGGLFALNAWKGQPLEQRPDVEVISKFKKALKQ
jgi:hypothetical protein